MIFKNWDFKIITANNGKEAIEKATKFHPDLILLDMKMPVMDGYEASDILSKDPTLKSIPIVAVTASALKKDEEYISERCNGYLRKPISKNDLIYEILKFLPYHISEISSPVNLVEETELLTVALLPEEVNKLYEIAMLGDMDEIKTYTKLLEQKKPHYVSFTKKLRELAEDFQDQEVLELVEQYKELLLT